jgi:hypothetical protein
VVFVLLSCKTALVCKNSTTLRDFLSVIQKSSLIRHTWLMYQQAIQKRRKSLKNNATSQSKNTILYRETDKQYRNVIKFLQNNAKSHSIRTSHLMFVNTKYFRSPQIFDANLRSFMTEIDLHYSHTHTLHTYIHTYIHTYTHTYIHTYIHTHTHTYIHTYIHAQFQRYKTNFLYQTNSVCRCCL